MNVTKLFEDELTSRGLVFSMDEATGRHVIEFGETHLLVSLDNLKRDVQSDGDIGRIGRFIDLLKPSLVDDDTISPERLYWSLEPHNSDDASDIRTPISDQVDRALVHYSADGRLIAFVTSDMLAEAGISIANAGERAFANLSKALLEATIEVQEISGVKLGFLNTDLPFKASLVLATNLKEVTRDKIGWPLLAVCPDRGFLYLWAAQHADFTGRVGSVVIDEFASASYPISTEVYEISDTGIRAIGEFPRKQINAPRNSE